MKKYIFFIVGVVVSFGITVYASGGATSALGGLITGTSFSATATSATSTFSGGLTVGSTNFVVQGGAASVGIGTNPGNGIGLDVNGVLLIEGSASGIQLKSRDVGTFVSQWYANVGKTCLFDQVGTNDFMCATTGSKLSIGSSTPLANFQATVQASNATTSIIFGKSNNSDGTVNTKGECLTFHDTAGTPVYGFIATGATSFTYTTVIPTGCVK